MPARPRTCSLARRYSDGNETSLAHKLVNKGLTAVPFEPHQPATVSDKLVRREDLAMTLTIFDPITGKHVTITRPEKPRS